MRLADLLSLSLLLALVPTYALRVNRTIDDQNGDEATGLLPNYAPAGAWSFGPECSKCVVKPNPERTFQGTWHDTTQFTFNPEPSVMTLLFNGTAIYAYCIIANQVPAAATVTNLTFTLDGDIVGTYLHIPDTTFDFEYNVSVYANNSLPNGQHTFTLETVQGKNISLALFDYATYTFESASPSSSSRSSSLAAIVGGSVGGGVALLLLCICIFWLLRRRSQKPPEIAGADEIVEHRALKIEPFATFLPGPSSGSPTQSAASSNERGPNPSFGTQTPASSLKAARHRKGVSGQIQEQERHAAGSRAQGTPRPAPTEDADTPASVLEQIDILKGEMERLKTQQRQMMLDVAPPEYEGGPSDADTAG